MNEIIKYLISEAYSRKEVLNYDKIFSVEFKNESLESSKFSKDYCWIILVTATYSLKSNFNEWEHFENIILVKTYFPYYILLLTTGNIIAFSRIVKYSRNVKLYKEIK